MNEPPDLAAVDEKAIRAYRAERIRQELRRRDLEAVLVLDPINLRYATGTRNMQVWTMHNVVRYALVLAHGPTVLFDLAGSRHLSATLESVSDIRASIAFDYMLVAVNAEEMARRWAAQIHETLNEHGCAALSALAQSRNSIRRSGAASFRTMSCSSALSISSPLRRGDSRG